MHREKVIAVGMSGGMVDLIKSATDPLDSSEEPLMVVPLQSSLADPIEDPK